MALEIMGYDIEAPLPLMGVSIWNIIMFLIVLAVGIIVVKIAARSIKKAMLRAKMQEILAEFTTRILRMILYVFVVGAALGFLGVDVGAAMVSISVVLGFVLGFALGDTLSNIAAGFMVAITKPFLVGHYVTIAGESGVIKAVGISVTELDTPDNKHIIIPNKVVWGSSIVNFSKNATRRIDMEAGVSYSDDLDKVMKVTMAILTSHPNVLKDPAPQVAVKEMADSAIIFVVRPWVNNADYWPVYFELQKALKQAYDREGISIPFPQMDVHMKEK
ncbi:MAG: mechanosensitive ion channel [Candidatus Thermoplasmatota archaeon]|nr:mechanosensitive ion channel [Candidatus Thermoplasmatota archaeon]